MRHLTRLPIGMISLILILGGGLQAEPPVSRLDGSPADLSKLPADADLAAGAFEMETLVLDATQLPRTEYTGTRSRTLQVEPDRRYTLGIRFRAKGKGLLSVGIQWHDPSRPPGLVEAADLKAIFTERDAGRLRVLTFRSDPELSRVQILLKAYGGIACDITDIKLVEGWYAD